MCSMSDEISASIKEHLIELKTSLKEYFRNKKWIKNPFKVNIEFKIELPDSDIESLIDLLYGTQRHL